MVAQLRRDGIAVDVDPQTYPNGRFVRLTVPKGNPIQLWQPRRKGNLTRAGSWHAPRIAGHLEVIHVRQESLRSWEGNGGRVAGNPAMMVV
jgi:hypothetical protein